MKRAKLIRRLPVVKFPSPSVGFATISINGSVPFHGWLRVGWSRRRQGPRRLYRADER